MYLKWKRQLGCVLYTLFKKTPFEGLHLSLCVCVCIAVCLSLYLSVCHSVPVPLSPPRCPSIKIGFVVVVKMFHRHYYLFLCKWRRRPYGPLSAKVRLVVRHLGVKAPAALSCRRGLSIGDRCLECGAVGPGTLSRPPPPVSDRRWTPVWVRMSRFQRKFLSLKSEACNFPENNNKRQRSGKLERFSLMNRLFFLVLLESSIRRWITAKKAEKQNKPKNKKQRRGRQRGQWIGQRSGQPREPKRG